MKKHIKNVLLVSFIFILIINITGCNNREREQEIDNFNRAFWFADYFNFIAYFENEIVRVRTALFRNDARPVSERYTSIVIVHTFEEAQVHGDNPDVLPVWPSDYTYRGVIEFNAIIENLYDSDFLWRLQNQTPDISIFPITTNDLIDKWDDIFEVIDALHDLRRLAIRDASRGINSVWRWTRCEDMPA